MQSLFDFIVSPVGKRYNNEIKVGNQSLVINASIESFKSVNNYARVVKVPKAFTSTIKEGDILVIHHNVFRRFYDIRGNQKDSRSLFKDDMYFCKPDQIYLYKTEGKEFKSYGDRCFVIPLKNNDMFSSSKEQKLIGIVKHDNSSLNKNNIHNGDLVGYTPNSEYDFLVNGERVYCMKSNDIVIKYEYKGDEKEYNPSWASSS